MTNILSVCLITFAFSYSAHAVDSTDSKSQNAVVTEAKPADGGAVRAPSPKILDPNRQGYFQLGVGPAYGAGLKNDSLMYDVTGSYNFNVSDKWTLKGLADASFASGSVSSRVLDFGIGGEYYFPDVTMFTTVPYLGADLGVGFARNAIEQTATGLTLGLGAGFRFQAQAINYDINAHFEQLTAQAGDAAPSIFALRGAVTF